MSLRRFLPALLLGPLAVAAGNLFSSSDGAAPPRATKGVSFHLRDPRREQEVALEDFRDKKALVVVFLGTECPVSNAYLPVLAALDKEYADKGVQVLGINANHQDTAAAVAAHARKHDLSFPVLKDAGNKVADLLGARRTPEALVLDADRTVRYQGRIDDQFGVDYSRPGKPTRRDLVLALGEVLAGKRVSRATTSVAGCFISRAPQPRRSGKITWARDVSRIVQHRCQTCHRPGQIGPMALESYADVLDWSETIREVVEERRMPPWHADPRYGKFANDRSLSAEERRTLLAWIDQGLAKGDDRDLPPPPTFPKDWGIGKPDLVVTMPKAFDVPARKPKGGIPYQYFTVDPGFKEDRWVVRAEARPGAPEVVHHIVLFIQPKGEFFNPEGPGNVLCGTAPGDMPLVLPQGTAKKVPAGARLVFQMHYTPNGKAQSDRSSVGLVFGRQKPRHRILTRPIYPPRFIMRLDRIPAGADNHRMESDFDFPQAGHIIAFMPHMHLRGKDFLYEARHPDGKKETLLLVPRYNFNWQSVYRCVEPVAMPKGSTLHCVAHFDNSAKNPSNPDPTRTLSWGDQTWEEMMIGWIDYWLDDEKP
jgi:peroxiredoxin